MVAVIPLLAVDDARADGGRDIRLRQVGMASLSASPVLTAAVGSGSSTADATRATNSARVTSCSGFKKLSEPMRSARQHARFSQLDGLVMAVDWAMSV